MPTDMQMSRMDMLLRWQLGGALHAHIGDVGAELLAVLFVARGKIVGIRRYPVQSNNAQFS